MKRLTCVIQIGPNEFKQVTDIKIKSSYESLTDSAVITIPRKISFGESPVARDSPIFKVGDPVRIFLGYDGDNKLLFTGFATGIKPGPPIEITCEDEMYMLKKQVVSKSWPKPVSLPDFLKEIITGYDVVAENVNLGKIRMDATPAAKLNEFSQTHSIKSFIRNGTLYSGRAYWKELQNPKIPVFQFQNNIITHDLQWQNKSDVHIQVKAVSTLRNNKKIVEVVGDAGGTLRTLNYYDLDSDQLKNNAQRDLDRFKFTGFKGSFTTFGEQVVLHGDKVNLIDPVIRERSGTYIAKSIERTFGSSGYRQKIGLEALV